MSEFGCEILIGAFEKNGLIYHVLLSQEYEGADCYLPTGRYKGVFLQPLKKNICRFYMAEMIENDLV